MPFKLSDVLIWSRSFEEYRLLFALSKADLNKRILSCADGTASFNATAMQQGIEVISSDPLYALPIDAIRNKVEISCEILYPKIVNAKEDFNWEIFKNPEELKDARLAAAEAFLKHFYYNAEHSRYINGQLPNLPFKDKSFDLALCGNFLFLYSEILDTEFHIRSVLELMRVATEVRIFPLIGNDRQVSEHLKSVLTVLESKGFQYEIVKVDYHFTKGANQMLRIIC